MSGARTKRISRELFLGAIGSNLSAIEPWVTDRLTAILEEEDAGIGECIYSRGDPPEHFYFVRQGHVELRRPGKPHELIDGPRAFGMLDALAERPRSHSAYATMPLQLMKIPADAWFELLEDSFELARMLVRRLIRVVSALEERLWAKGVKPVSPSFSPPEERGAPLDILERVLVLMNAMPLCGAGVQPLGDLAAASEELAFPAGERLIARGILPERVFVLIEGRVEASTENPRVSWPGSVGQAVTGLAAFGDWPSAWEARATTPARALAFRIDDWLDVMEENFEMVRTTLTALATEHERLVREL